MALITLEDYQERGVQGVARKLAAGLRSVIFQLATGGGKTIVFCAIAQRYIVNSGMRVLILVHREELLKQAREKLYYGFGIVSQPIVAGMRHIPDAQVYVGMVESAYRRIPMLKNIGLVIIDECHFANFNKIHNHFPAARIVGFSATPLAASKKDPLKNYYQDIVCGIDIPELIQLNKLKPERGLCQNITRAPKDVVDRNDLKVTGTDFDDGLMAMQFSKPKYVKAAVDAYEKYTPGTKLLSFNCNIDHSRKVEAEFLARGYKARHLDGETPDRERTEILEWYHDTPDAILNNVDVLSAGFDENTIETIMANRSTMSLPKWLQWCGRGSRPTMYKSSFNILDMGGNALAHGDWCDQRDWAEIFHNPPAAGKGKGNAPVKSCPQCDAIVPAQSRTCQYCGYEWPVKEEAPEGEFREMVTITKGINVKEIIEKNKQRKEHYSFFAIGDKLAKNAKDIIPEMTNESANFILQQYYQKTEEWCLSSNRKFNDWYQREAKRHLFNRLRESFPNWQPNNTN